MLTLARKPHTKIVMASKGLGDAVGTASWYEDLSYALLTCRARIPESSYAREPEG